MLYVREIEQLLQPYPGREFKVGNIVHEVCNGKPASARKREAARRAVRRALNALVEAGVLVQRPPEAKNGAPVWYSWKSGT